MKIQTTEEPPGTYVLKLEGDLDMSVSPQLRSMLLQVLHKAPSRLIVDISGVPYIDSSGIATFVEGLQLSRKANTRFVLAGATPPVESIFELAHLKGVFEMVADASLIVNGEQAG